MRFAIFLFMLSLVVVASAEDYVAINSMDGRDVLSGIFYANVKGLPVRFMPVPGGDAELFTLKTGGNHSILLIQSADVPISGFLQADLQSKNNTVELYPSSDGGATNLDLAQRSGATSFIVVDSAYSDGAISVLPYAAQTKSYVMLANKNNIAQVKAIVQGKKVMIYGLVDQEVRDSLASLNPETVGTGDDKYEDNVAIVKKTMDEFGINRVIIADGTFLEQGMVKGDLPVLLTGKLVPQPTYDFVKQEVLDGKLTGVMLLGNDLVVPIYDMRERIKAELAAQGLNKTLGITVKFGQAMPSAGTGVMGLDMFQMPAYQPKLDIGEVGYNSQSKSVMVRVDNTGDGSAYYSIEVRIKVDGNDYKVFSANGTNRIDRGEQNGVQYPIDLSGVKEGNVTALVLIKYGSSRSSLESFSSKEGPLTSISYTDNSDVAVQAARYDSTKQSVLVTIKNNANQPAYIFTRLGLTMSGAATNITGPGAESIDPGSLLVVEFPLQLSQADLAANKNVMVYLDYGARQGFLNKHGQYPVTLEEAAAAGGFPILIVAGLAVLVILVIVAVAAFFLMRKPQKK